MRPSRALIAALFLSAVPAAAADQADREIVGFSPDGAYFAFEEYGVEDRSGTAYSRLYILATASNDWAPGTPVSVRLADAGEATLARVRALALDRARPLLARHGLADDVAPGRVVVVNPLTELSADSYYVRFLPRMDPRADIALTLELEEFDVDAPHCRPGDYPYRGLRLVLTGADEAERTIAEDTALPAGRGCPIGYGISDVVTFYPDAGEPVLVAILNLFRTGDDGIDRRFIALAARFSE